MAAFARAAILAASLVGRGQLTTSATIVRMDELATGGRLEHDGRRNGACEGRDGAHEVQSLHCEYTGKWKMNSEFIRFGGENEYKVNTS